MDKQYYFLTLDSLDLYLDKKNFLKLVWDIPHQQKIQSKRFLAFQFKSISLNTQIKIDSESQLFQTYVYLLLQDNQQFKLIDKFILYLDFKHLQTQPLIKHYEIISCPQKISNITIRISLEKNKNITIRISLEKNKNITHNISENDSITISDFSDLSFIPSCKFVEQKIEKNQNIDVESLSFDLSMNDKYKANSIKKIIPQKTNKNLSLTFSMQSQSREDSFQNQNFIQNQKCEIHIEEIKKLKLLLEDKDIIEQENEQLRTAIKMLKEQFLQQQLSYNDQIQKIDKKYQNLISQMPLDQKKMFMQQVQQLKDNLQKSKEIQDLKSQIQQLNIQSQQSDPTKQNLLDQDFIKQKKLINILMKKNNQLDTEKKIYIEQILDKQKELSSLLEQQKTMEQQIQTFGKIRATLLDKIKVFMQQKKCCIQQYQKICDIIVGS